MPPTTSSGNGRQSPISTSRRAHVSTSIVQGPHRNEIGIRVTVKETSQVFFLAYLFRDRTFEGWLPRLFIGVIRIV